MLTKNGTPVTLRLNVLIIAPEGIPLTCTLSASENKKIQQGNTHDSTVNASRVKSGGFIRAIMAALTAVLGSSWWIKRFDRYSF